MSIKRTPQSKGIILVPMDVSSANDNTLVYAAELCQSGGHALMLMHAVHEPAGRPGMYRRLLQSEQLLPMELIAEKLCRKMLDDAQRRFPQFEPLASARLKLVIGQPAQRIAEVANIVGASLIVMNSGNRNGLSRMVSSSISHSVAKRTTIPVLRLDRVDTQVSTLDSTRVPPDTVKPGAAKITSELQPGMVQLPGAA